MIKIVAKPYSTTQYHPCLQQYKGKNKNNHLLAKLLNT
jgi:hypothetical protein